MNWFEGSIEDAIKAAKVRNCFFVVYVEGNDKLSETMTSVINSHEISAILESDKFVSVKIQHGSEEYNYFVKIYKHIPIPSLFLIGRNGVPVAVVHSSLNEDKQTIHNEILKSIKEERNENEGVFGLNATINEVASFIKVKELRNSSVNEKNSAESLPSKPHDSDTTDDIPISKLDSLFKNSSVIVSSEENQDAFTSIKQDCDLSTKMDNIVSASTLKVKDSTDITIDEENKVKNLSSKLADKQDLNISTSSSIHSVSNVISKKATNSPPEVEKEDEPLFVVRKIDESTKEGPLASITVSENTVFQSIFSDVSDMDAEQLDITEEPILEDYQHEKSEDSGKEQFSQLRRQLNRIAEEKIENELHRQRILKEIALDREERLARECDFALFQQSSLSEPIERTHNLERSEVHTIIQFRTPNGLAVTEVFSVNSTIIDLRSYVTHNIELHNRQFNLAVAFPSHTFTAEENNKTLEELDLVPNGVVLILPITTDSSALSCIRRRVANMFWSLASPMMSSSLYIRENIIRPVSESLWNFSRLPFVFLSPQLNGNSFQTSNDSVNAPFFESHRNTRIHVMADITNKDDDDENNTWNGNSTQQSQ